MSELRNFTFKPFDQMTSEDYQRVGFRSGLEIHQQLKTKRKLFCRCPAGCYSTEVDAEILRHMRPTLSELGEYDGTALMEFKTRKEILYLLNKETVCTYEMDDAPPFEIDPEAVQIALEIALLLDINLIGELHIARKQYLDGSIPTGFQRTTIFGIDGQIEACGRKIGIIQLGLEEDSCREVSDEGHTITYRTDRLGMPLIETVTYPDMQTPAEVAETAEIIRRLTRATGKVRTGHGAARQDVNVSVTGGTRIEIKGVPSIRRIPRLVYNEAMRQYELLKIRDELNARGITEDTFESRSADVTGIVRDTTYVPIRHAVDNDFHVHAVKLTGFKDILNWQTQEHTYFGQEISDRVKVIACLMDHPNILHTDSTELGLSRGQWNRIRKRLKADIKLKDTVVLVWGSKADVKTAVEEITIRAREATVGVPEETRQAFHDGTNGFERILPGPQRMYPDTDEPPFAIQDAWIEAIKKTLPDRPWESRRRLVELGLSENEARLIADTLQGPLFEQMIGEGSWNTKRLSRFFVRDYRYFSRKRWSVDRLTSDGLALLKTLTDAGELEKDALTYVIKDWVFRQTDDLKAVLADYVKTGAEDITLQAMIQQAQKEQFTLINKSKASRLNYFMGRLMDSLRGRVAASVVRESLLEVIEGHDDNK